jgi:hypothetical protein
MIKSLLAGVWLLFMVYGVIAVSFLAFNIILYGLSEGWSVWVDKDNMLPVIAMGITVILFSIYGAYDLGKRFTRPDAS